MSPIDLMRFTKSLTPGLDRNDRENYVGIAEGGSVTLTLENSIGTGQIVSEACTPYSQLLPMGEDPGSEIGDATWKRLKELYERYSKRLKDCGSCNDDEKKEIAEIRKVFAFKSTDEQVLEAFSEPSYDQMLDRLLVPEECRFEGQAEINPRYEVAIFPKVDFPRKKAYAPFLRQIMSVIKDQKVPISLVYCAEP